MIALLAWLAGCDGSTGGAPDGPPDDASLPTDADGDGFGWTTDCDDADGSAHPGASDPAGDGVDQDCDGGDGVSAPLAPSATATLSQERGMQSGVSLAVAQLDEDPLAEVVVGSQQHYEIANQPVDGFGAVWRLDGAGLAPTASWIGGPGLDATAGLMLGQRVAVLGSGPDAQLVLTDGNGLWIVAADAASGSPLDLGDDAHRLFFDGGKATGLTIATGDLVGDPAEDLAVQCATVAQSNESLSSICVFAGPFTADRPADDFATSVGLARAQGQAVAIGDVDGDGVGDLVGGAPYEAGEAGVASVFLGPLTGPELGLDAADAQWEGEAPGDWLGERGGCADLDGDGTSDTLVDAFAWPEGARYGKVYGLALDTPAVVDAPWIVEGSPGFNHLGAAWTSDDLDGDGQQDLVLASPSLPALDPTVPGRVMVYFGPVSGRHSDLDADLMFHGERPGDMAGAGLAAGDVDGDGQSDLVIGAPNSDDAGEDAGKVYLLLGPLGG